jgi:hypothetical protein
MRVLFQDLNVLMEGLQPPLLCEDRHVSLSEPLGAEEIPGAQSTATNPLDWSTAIFSHPPSCDLPGNPSAHASPESPGTSAQRDQVQPLVDWLESQDGCCYSYQALGWLLRS